MLNRITIIFASLVSLASLAEMPPIMKGKIGDVYYTDSATRVYSTLGEKQSDSLPKVKCWPGYNLVEAAPDIAFGFLSFYPDRVLYKAESPWFEIEVTYRILDSNSYRCSWNRSAIEKDLEVKFPQFLTGIAKYLTLESLSADGTAIRAKATYQGKALGDITSSGRQEVSVAFQLNLKQCQLDDGQMVNSFVANDKSTDLRDIITRLRQRGFRNFQRCDLAVQSPAVIGEIGRGGRLGAYGENYTVVILKDDRNLYKSSGERLSEKYLPTMEKPDPASESRAMNAAKSFVEFITDDYGDLLYDLSEKKSAQEAEKKEAIRGFFEKNQDKIQAWFKTIDENYGAVSLNNKIAMLISIQDMYKTISGIESTVSRSNINLDRVIRSYQK